MLNHVADHRRFTIRAGALGAVALVAGGLALFVGGNNRNQGATGTPADFRLTSTAFGPAAR